MNKPDVDHFYFNGEHYDAKSNNDDVPFWIQQAQKYGSPVLELAVGTGRIAIPMAKEGFEVTGIDMSDSMLEQARKKIAEENVSLDLIKADIRDFDLNKKFSLITIPANTIVHFHQSEDLDACLSCIAKHLAPNGRLIIETHNPAFKYLLNAPDKPPYTSQYPSPGGNGEVTITSSHHYDMATQINTVVMKYKLPDQSKEIVDEVRARIYFPKELEALARHNGFTLENKYGNHNAEAFASDSPKQILILRLA